MRLRAFTNVAQIFLQLLAAAAHSLNFVQFFATTAAASWCRPRLLRMVASALTASLRSSPANRSHGHKLLKRNKGYKPVGNGAFSAASYFSTAFSLNPCSAVSRNETRCTAARTPHNPHTNRSCCAPALPGNPQTAFGTQRPQAAWRWRA